MMDQENGHLAQYACGCLSGVVVCAEHPTLPDSSFRLLCMELADVARTRCVAFVSRLPDEDDPTDYPAFNRLHRLMRAAQDMADA